MVGAPALMCADPSARTARCSQTAPAIEKAITEASLGLNPSSDGKVIRAKVPKASKEIRDASLKRLSEAAEVVSQAPATCPGARAARCAAACFRCVPLTCGGGWPQTKRNVRKVRHKALDSIKKLEHVSSDDTFRMQKDVQGVTDEAVEAVAALQAKKKADIESG